jgi:hypothetical protein
MASGGMAAPDRVDTNPTDWCFLVRRQTEERNDTPVHCSTDFTQNADHPRRVALDRPLRPQPPVRSSQGTLALSHVEWWIHMCTTIALQGFRVVRPGSAHPLPTRRRTAPAGVVLDSHFS